MGFWDRARQVFTSTAPKAKDYKPPVHWPEDWFQLGMTPPMSGSGAVVEACVSAYAQTIAQLPPKHYRMLASGERILVPNSRAVQVINRPNFFQTRSDFLLNLVHAILYQGNGYWVRSGGTTGNPDEIYLLDPRATHARRVGAGGTETAVFYGSGGTFAEMIDNPEAHVAIPARDVGHVRLFTPVDPLLGVTPLTAAAASVSANNSITSHQAAFFRNMTRPSGVLSTDMDLSKEQMAKLREAWELQSKNLNSGGVPILANGLKWNAMSISSQDAQLVEAWKMSVSDVARVFRVPPPLIGDLQNSTFNNAETLMRFFLASGLGFMIDHIEQTFKAFFRLPEDEIIELDHSVLLRTDLQARITALGEGVQKGVLTPNEARLSEGKPPVEGGDQVFLQAQMEPITAERATPSLGEAMLADLDNEGVPNAG